MALITPKVFVAGDPLPASDMNTYVSDILGSLENPPSCKAYAITNQSIANAVATAVALDLEYWDNSGMHSNTVNNSRITVPVAGVYQVSWFVRWATSATLGYRINRIHRNAGIVDETSLAHAAGSPVSQGTGTNQVKCAVNDYFELMAYQVTGGALSIDAAAIPVSLAVTWCGFG